MPGRDTRARFQGVFARHQKRCRVSVGGDPKTCNCTPRYHGVVWDRAARQRRKIRRFWGVTEARNARKDLADALARGALGGVAGPRFGDAREQFVRDAREGVALNKVGSQLPAECVE